MATDFVYCANKQCDYGTENDVWGNWGFVCPECGLENTITEENDR